MFSISMDIIVQLVAAGQEFCDVIEYFISIVKARTAWSRRLSAGSNRFG